MPSNISPWSEPSRRRRIALHEPAISTAMLTVSMRPTVVTLCGIVTKGAADISEPEQRPQKGGIVVRLDAHRHHHGVDAVSLEPRIIDHRRGEALGRIAETRDDLGAPADPPCICRAGGARRMG
jgi:hypothetical protein